MREIKFRVWDRDYECMHICGENDHDRMIFLGDDNLACYYNLQNGCGSGDTNDDAYRLMQFTGLKDKHGREIYEGDILTNDFGDIQEVRYANGRWACVLHKRSTSYWPAQFLDCVYMGWLVIGNVHEHPELLRGGEGK